eukprot:TRINITY_DN911_c0_g1_i1.p1 TRINITY_DN911_c0_g1~~TRINITY_DN911_c0_g1_i1.p1  ORF type:complete len:702 (-),score=217.01 TRINITY_DN911_c0_g1_i1:245-2350(-)
MTEQSSFYGGPNQNGGKQGKANPSSGVVLAPGLGDSADPDVIRRLRNLRSQIAQTQDVRTGSTSSLTDSNPPTPTTFALNATPPSQVPNGNSLPPPTQSLSSPPQFPPSSTSSPTPTSSSSLDLTQLTQSQPPPSSNSSSNINSSSNNSSSNNSSTALRLSSLDRELYNWTVCTKYHCYYIRTIYPFLPLPLFTLSEENLRYVQSSSQLDGSYTSYQPTALALCVNIALALGAAICSQHYESHQFFLRARQQLSLLWDDLDSYPVAMALYALAIYIRYISFEVGPNRSQVSTSFDPNTSQYQQSSNINVDQAEYYIQCAMGICSNLNALNSDINIRCLVESSLYTCSNGLNSFLTMGFSTPFSMTSQQADEVVRITKEFKKISVLPYYHFPPFHNFPIPSMPNGSSNNNNNNTASNIINTNGMGGSNSIGTGAAGTGMGAAFSAKDFPMNALSQRNMHILNSSGSIYTNAYTTIKHPPPSSNSSSSSSSSSSSTSSTSPSTSTSSPPINSNAPAIDTITLPKLILNVQSMELQLRVVKDSEDPFPEPVYYSLLLSSIGLQSACYLKSGSMDKAIKTANSFIRELRAMKCQVSWLYPGMIYFTVLTLGVLWESRRYQECNELCEWMERSGGGCFWMNKMVYNKIYEMWKSIGAGGMERGGGTGTGTGTGGAGGMQYFGGGGRGNGGAAASGSGASGGKKRRK